MKPININNNNLFQSYFNFYTQEKKPLYKGLSTMDNKSPLILRDPVKKIGKRIKLLKNESFKWNNPVVIQRDKS